MLNRKNILTLIGTILIIGLSIFILIKTDIDEIKNNLSGNFSFYLHIKEQKLSQMLPQHQELFQDFINPLFPGITLSLTDWQLLNGTEMAVVKYQNSNWQIAIITQEDSENLLKSNLVPYSKIDNLLLFPTLQTSAKLQTGQRLKNNIPKSIRAKFHDAYLFYSGQEKLFIPPIFSEYLPNDQIFALIDYSENKILAKTNIKAPKNKMNYSPQLNQNSYLYFNNLIPEQMPVNAGQTKENLIYLLLNQISKPTELAHNGNLTEIVVRNITMSELQDIIKFTLASIYPTEKIKYLYDGTPATQLIIDPKSWVFNQNANNYSYLENDFLKIELQNNEESFIKIIINQSNQGNAGLFKVSSPSNCQTKSKQIISFMPQIKNINKVLINPNIFKTISICID